MVWEAVYAVHDYYDGPRFGIADYAGSPHLYESRWDHSESRWEGHGEGADYREHYWLCPISTDLFELALEAEAITERWRNARGRPAEPALPQDQARYEELKSILESRLQLDGKTAFQRAGQFVGELVLWSEPGP